MKRCDYLDWQPAICVFEIERSLVSAERKSIMRLKALQFLLAVHDEYLKKGKETMGMFLF